MLEENVHMQLRREKGFYLLRCLLRVLPVLEMVSPSICGQGSVREVKFWEAS